MIGYYTLILEKGGDFFITKLKQTVENMVNYIGCDLDKVGTIEVDGKSAFIQRAQNDEVPYVAERYSAQLAIDHNFSN